MIRGKDYMLIEDVPEAGRAGFEKWIDGQTVPIVIVDGAERCGFYVGDYKRWQEIQRRGYPETVLEWD